MKKNKTTIKSDKDPIFCNSIFASNGPFSFMPHIQRESRV